MILRGNKEKNVQNSAIHDYTSTNPHPRSQSQSQSLDNWFNGDKWQLKLKSSWSHHEQSEAKKKRLCALDKLGEFQEILYPMGTEFFNFGPGRAEKFTYKILTWSFKSNQKAHFLEEIPTTNQALFWKAIAPSYLSNIQV